MKKNTLILTVMMLSLAFKVCAGDMARSRADVNAVVDDINGYTALMVAAASNDLKSVKALLKNPEIDVNKRTAANGYTAMAIAAVFGYTDIVKLLLDAGADVNIATRVSNYTPLSSAVQSDDLNMVGMLLKVPGIRINTIDETGYSPLKLAVVKGRADMVKYLLDAGAEVSDEIWDAAHSIPNLETWSRIARLLNDHSTQYLPKQELEAVEAIARLKK